MSGPARGGAHAALAFPLENRLSFLWRFCMGAVGVFVWAPLHGSFAWANCFVLCGAVVQYRVVLCGAFVLAWVALIG
jgi:hypothetical protein